MLAADGLDDAALDRIVPELGQGPAAVGEADHRGRLVGEPAESSPLLGGDPRLGPAPVAVTHPVQALTVEGMQVGVGRVGMQSEEARDRRRIPTLGVQHDCFGATQLPAVVGGVQELTQLPQFSSGGAPSGHGAGHGRTPVGEAQPSIVPRVR